MGSSSLTRDQTRALALGAPILSPWLLAEGVAGPLPTRVGLPHEDDRPDHHGGAPGVCLWQGPQGHL